MPKRRKKQRQRRMIEGAIEMIEAGDAWREYPEDPSSMVFVLVTGFDFFNQYKNDEICSGWEELGEEITAEHIRRKPKSRPWGWWKYDAPEMRRVIEGESESGSNRRLPAFQDPTLPAWAKNNWFGRPNTYDGYEYETEMDYLDRLNLFSEEENDLDE